MGVLIQNYNYLLSILSDASNVGINMDFPLFNNTNKISDGAFTELKASQPKNIVSLAKLNFEK